MRNAWIAAVVAIAGAAAAGDARFDEEGTADVAPAVVQPPIGALPDEIVAVAAEVANRPLPERMDAVSRALLGRPYLADPLGEGEGVDADPFARYDVYDCLTFVEEVLALTLSGDPNHAAATRNALRYTGEPRYGTRRHFMELQWIPGNVAAGWVRDTTREYGETVRLEREVTPALWKNWGRRALFHLTDDELPVGVMALDVLPMATAREVADRIRPGSILLTVREDHAWVPLWITHVGLVFRDGDKAVTRHATKIGNGGSRDHGLDWYLAHIEKYTNWKTLGIAILEPVEPGPRISRLP